MANSQGFSYVYILDQNNRVTNRAFTSNPSIIDTPDNANDDTNVLSLGDRFSVSAQFGATYSTFEAIYGGRDTSIDVPDSIYLTDQNNNAYLLSNVSYQTTQQVTVDPSLSYTIVCFVTGTLIRTGHGDVAVEDLAAGDLIVTASGERRPIRWIGNRTVAPRRHPRPHEAQPIRICAHAFGENRPARDLFVSHGHSIAVDVNGGALIPAGNLVNGATIVQDDVESVTYWHVELDTHDVLLAEGLPAESYLNMGNRPFFADGAVVEIGASPDIGPAARTHADFCRPFHDAGPLVIAVRTQLRISAEALGWKLVSHETWTDVHLEVDGRIVQPETCGLTARFVLPAGARDVWLVSPTTVPCHVSDSPDRRALGLCVSSLSLTDGLGRARTVALDDPLLCVGFHAPEPDHRWTAGRARLPAALLVGLDGEVVLRVDLAACSLPRWIAPEVADGSVLKMGASLAA